MTKRERGLAIERELERRIAHFREQTFESLERLPEIHDEEVDVLGEKVLFSVFRERDADGGLLLIVRADQRRALGFTWATSRGFHVLPTGEQRAASPDEVD